MILVVVDSMERCYFFLRLARPVRREFAFLFLVSEPLAWGLLTLAGYPAVYVRARRRRLAPAATADPGGATAAIEVLNARMPVARARDDAREAWRVARMLVRRHRIAQCVLWNGQQLLCRAVARACVERRVPLRFLELSNLPDKLFADPLGVNALSSLAAAPDALDALDALPLPSDALHRRWLARYEAYKARPLPQATTRPVRKLLSACNYLLKHATHGVARLDRRALRVAQALPPPREALALDPATLMRRRYVFLPLQVAGDTQLRLHSDVDNLQAIEQAVRIAQAAGADLIVKLHPAEYDAAELARVLASQRRHRFALATTPTLELIRHAAAVVTINSTVGLEAMLHGKPVAAFGRCFYRSFDHARLLKYIHGFLVDGIDYFATGAIAPDAARRVFGGGRER
ncbi:capsular biosynthesis protein [Burkholderia guangdongensis]|uniref:capsular polysaccharide export protein, LipB/KpsS family n=1 Tax=Burkholderia guangdongensis TaxID=1792500 RepID=UPI0015CAF5B0|nr:capsular biosynthesis protein [Burkholderia guangdongensis]